MSLHPRIQFVLDSVTSLATVAAALAVVSVVLQSRPGNQQTTKAPTPTRSPVTTVDGIETSLSASSKHHDGAKIAIIEFSDFECPYCGRYAREIYPQVQKELVDKGVVNYSFRQFPLESIHKAAFKAGEASACAGAQDKFWEMHDRLFQNQKQLTEPDLLDYAMSLGLDGSRFKSCLADQMAGSIRIDQEEAKKFGVNSTPTFLVGLVQSNGKVKVVRKLSGAVPYENFKSVVDEVLKGV